MFNEGDVVFGSFAMAGGVVLRHYSVVLAANADEVLLAYTTSLKEPGDYAQKFNAEDMRLANWTKPCRWDGSTVCVVPNTCVRRTGRISKATFNAIRTANVRAAMSGNLRTASYSEEVETLTA